MPALHPELVLAKRNVALANDKLRALECEALRLSVFIIPLPDRVDALMDSAEPMAYLINSDVTTSNTSSLKAYVALPRSLGIQIRPQTIRAATKNTGKVQSVRTL